MGGGPQVVSREEAKSCGLRHYFTGDLCSKGHLSKRYVSTGGCAECLAAIGKSEEGRTYKQQHYLKNKAQYDEKNNKWAAENREKSREIKKKWREANLEKAREIARVSARKHYAANPVKYRERSRQWGIENPDKKSARLAVWRKENPVKIRAHRANRRTRKAAAPGSLTSADIKAIVARQKGKCAACGEKAKLDMDHIMPLFLGGSGHANNFQGLCRSCNCRKHAKHPIDFNRSLGLLL